MSYYAEGEPYGGGNLPPSTPYVEKSPGRTRQDDLESSKIGNIVKRYLKTRELPVTGREAFFADVSSMPDYQTAFGILEAGANAFKQLPAEVKTRFDNDPAKFLDFTNDAGNRDEMVTMGLLDAPDEVTAAAAIAGDAARTAASDPAPEPAPPS